MTSELDIFAKEYECPKCNKVGVQYNLAIGEIGESLRKVGTVTTCRLHCECGWSLWGKSVSDVIMQALVSTCPECGAAILDKQPVHNYDGKKVGALRGHVLVCHACGQFKKWVKND